MTTLHESIPQPNAHLHFPAISATRIADALVLGLASLLERLGLAVEFDELGDLDFGLTQQQLDADLGRMWTGTEAQ